MFKFTGMASGSVMLRVTNFYIRQARTPGRGGKNYLMFKTIHLLRFKYQKCVIILYTCDFSIGDANIEVRWIWLNSSVWSSWECVNFTQAA